MNRKDATMLEATLPEACASQSACRLIEAAATAERVTVHELSRRTGVSRSFIYKVFNAASDPFGAPKVSLETIELLAQGLRRRLVVSLEP